MGAADAVKRGAGCAALAADHVAADAGEHGVLVEEFAAARAVAALQREGVVMDAALRGDAQEEIS